MSRNSENEDVRLAALHALDILDSKPEAEFDAIVKAAAVLCDKPMSLISLVDERRQWFKANTGLPGVSETPRSVAFCARTIHEDKILQVDDCTSDDRFADNPLVTGEPDLRFYAGVPLQLSDGEKVGTLCVLDQKAGSLNDAQREGLIHLASAVVHAMESRRVARELIINESRFRAMCSSLSVGVFAVDSQNRQIFANDRMHQIMGTSAEDDPELDRLRNVLPEDRDTLETHCREARENGSELEIEVRIRCEDNRVIHVRLMSSPVFSDEGVLVGRVGSVEDVTADREHLAEQYRALALLRQTGSLAQVGGWELDLRDQTVTWTQQTCLIHGLPTDHEPKLDSALDFYVPESREVLVKALDHLSETGSTFDLELRLQRADGRCIWVRVVGEADLDYDQIVRLRGAIQDIDEQVIQRDALRVAHERITLATDSGEIGVWEWDLEQDRIVWTSQMLSLYGQPGGSGNYTMEQWGQFVHQDDRQRAEQCLDQALRQCEYYEDEFRIVRPDGKIRHLKKRAHIRRDDNGRAMKLVGVSWDVSDLRELAGQLAEQHELLQVTLQSIDDAVITADREGRITWLNPAAEKLTRWHCSDAVGQPLNIVYRLQSESVERSLESPVAECLHLEQPIIRDKDMVLLAADGARVGVEDSVSPIMGRQGEPLGVVLVFRDVTEQRRLVSEISHRAMHDELTQVFNRSEFEVRLQTLLEGVQQIPQTHALMFIDLDQFKQVNDACGHSVGDQLLRQIANLLIDNLREGDLLARLGGDEFGVILTNCNSVDARGIAQQICRKVDGFRFLHDGRRFRVGASIGLVPLDDRWDSVASVMQAADSACYAAKEAGRNRVHVWFDTDQSMRARRSDMQWATRLQQSLEENRFELHAQKLLRLEGQDKGVQAEILIRLRDESGEVILPTAFLSAAERFHLATRIDRWVLQKTIDFIGSCSNRNALDRLWVNLSGQSVTDKEFHRDAIQMLMKAGGKICRHLCIEIKETAAAANVSEASRFIERLNTLGVVSVLDDFGVGATSFGYLKGLPVGALKIDGQFIGNLVNDPLDEAAVRCFVDVARIVGLNTVAEHVDSPQALERIKALGVNHAQGFLIHRPQPLQELFDDSLVESRPKAGAGSGI